ncbi:MAG: WYL domain-containing protein [Acidobacteria bacterium]|nr:WYL domain-containing protein [Acidobacteriota bacterium]
MKQNQRSHDSRKSVRIHQLDALIRSGRCRSAAQAARELDVKSGRTIMRDFDILRGQGAELAYDPQARIWRYLNKSFVLPAMQMSEGELVAIFLAERLMQQYRGAPFEQQLHTAFAKIVENLPEQITVDLSASSNAYTFEVGPTSDFDPANYAAISRAIAERRTLEIIYYVQNRGTQETRRINPYHLHNHRGDWYVIAYDHLRQAMRDFHLSRIRTLTVTEERFPPPDFNRAEYLQAGFDMYRGGEEYDVEIEFDEYQARWIRERREWHAGEEREDLPNGGLLLRMRVAGLEAVKRFVMQYGAHATVRQPAALRAMIAAELCQMCDGYGITRPSANSDRQSQV